jgi:hypothetical protein
MYACLKYTQNRQFKMDTFNYGKDFSFWYLHVKERSYEFSACWFFLKNGVYSHQMLVF